MTGKPRTYGWIWFALAVALVIWLASNDIAFADDDHNHHNSDGGDSSADSVLDSVISDDSLGIGLAFSYGMGDVDINEGQNCMGSEQKANIIWGKQQLALNAWCASLFYELNGKHTFAAKMRCGIPDIIEQYTTIDECVIDQDLSPIPDGKTADIFEEQRTQDQSIAVVQMAQYELEERLEALENKPTPRPQVFRQAAVPPDPEPLLTLAEKEAILETLMYSKKGDEDE